MSNQVLVVVAGSHPRQVVYPFPSLDGSPGYRDALTRCVGEIHSAPGVRTTFGMTAFLKNIADEALTPKGKSTGTHAYGLPTGYALLPLAEVPEQDRAIAQAAMKMWKQAPTSPIGLVIKPKRSCEAA